tara:strand:- start:351 stop:617 length:267 start_codon:yes stop_codon:yes gene_type:complete
MHYKAPDNSLHFIEPAFAHMLPDGCIAITDEEAEALRPAPPEPTYQQLRAAEYPPATDYLDAIVKGDREQMQAYKDACLAVKAKYPKL